MLKEFGVTLDLTRDVSNEIFSINQNDLNNIQLNFNFLNEGAPIDLTGGTIRIAIKKPDHSTVIQDAEIIEIGKAQLLLNTQSYSENGDCIGEVYFYQNDQTHVFKSKFKYFVVEAIMNDETVESANEWQSINQALANYIPREDVEVIVDSKIDEMAESGELSVSTDWTDISNKPTAFEPIDHTHVMADITDLDLSNADIDLSSKADLIHTHTIADITELQTILDSKADDSDLTTKADVNHTHTIADVAALQTALNNKADDSDLTTKANLNHTHTIADVAALQTALDNKADDSDLTTKADVIHDHAIADVTELQTILDSKANSSELAAKADDSELATKADVIHTHLWTDITNKPLTFEPADHTHVKAEITDLGLSSSTEDGLMSKEDKAFLDGFSEGGAPGESVIVEDNLTSISTANALSANMGKTLNESKAPIDHDHAWEEITNKPLTFPVEAHDHEIADVTNLQTILDGKADDADLSAKADTTHTHLITDITGMQTALDSKADDSDLAAYYTKTETDGKYLLKTTAATTTTLGAVKAGELIDIAGDGTINPKKHTFSAYSTAQQGFAGGVATKVNFDYLSPEMDQAYKRYIVSVTGAYFVLAKICINATWSQGAVGTITLYRNGAPLSTLMQYTNPIASAPWISVSASASLSAGDYIEIYFQSSVYITTNFNTLDGYLI